MNKLLVGTIFAVLPLCVIAQEVPPPPTSAVEAVAADSKSLTKPVAPKPAVKGSVRADRLDLDTTVVTGNRELPKVLYIVPWKRADLGELPAQPFNTLLDEVLQPVDRDVFKREVKYFHAVSSGGAAAAKPNVGAAPPSAPAQ